MPEVNSTVGTVLAWNGTDDEAVAWAEEHASEIEEEAASGNDGVVAAAFSGLLALADSDQDGAAWSLMAFFGKVPARQVAAVGVHKLFAFFSAGARRFVHLFQPLAMLVHRYADRLRALAQKIGVTGFQDSGVPRTKGGA